MVEPVRGGGFVFPVVYMLPLISPDVATSSWPVGILAVMLLWFVVAAGQGPQHNPLLSLFGYVFYRAWGKDDITKILVTRNRHYELEQQLRWGLCPIASSSTRKDEHVRFETSEGEVITR